MFESFRKSVSKLAKKITTTEFSSKQIEKISREVHEILVQNEVAVKTADKICSMFNNKLLKLEYKRLSNVQPLILNALKDVLLSILSPSTDVDLIGCIEESKQKKIPYVMAFFGVNGVGKTLSIAKLGFFFKNKGYSCVFAAGDTYRAGSIQQLEKHGERLNIRVVSQTYGSDAAAVAFDAINHAHSKKIDVVLIDTAGRVETSSNLMSELQKICKVVEPNIKIFVGDALTGNSLVSQVNLFNKNIGIDGSILNKMDADVKGGAAFSIVDITTKPILFIGTGQKYSDLKQFDAKEIVSKIIP
ncbi:MAG: signal recognition particle-docking protein FtsY [Candidatus Heimdallarchaeaceae archaeon]